MNDHYITTSEVLLLATVFVGPFVAVGAVVQYRMLRRAKVRAHWTSMIVVLAAVVSIALTWILLYVVPMVIPLVNAFDYGGPLIVPALIATSAVTLLIAWFAKSRGNKPTR